jgi:hypothetical protein
VVECRGSKQLLFLLSSLVLVETRNETMKESVKGQALELFLVWLEPHSGFGIFIEAAFEQDFNKIMFKNDGL